MKWFRAELTNGKLTDLKEVEQREQSSLEIIYFKAADLEDARRKAVREYCNTKARLRKKALKKEGKCSCGRVNDNAADGLYRCSVCIVRHKAHRDKAKQRLVTPVRDESARVEKNLQRQRDRKAEISLEVLCLVRKRWQGTRTVGQFTLWLDEQIEILTKRPKESECYPKEDV